MNDNTEYDNMLKIGAWVGEKDLAILHEPFNKLITVRFPKLHFVPRMININMGEIPMPYVKMEFLPTGEFSIKDMVIEK